MRLLIFVLCSVYIQTSVGFNYKIADKLVFEESSLPHFAPRDDTEYSFSTFIDHFDPEADPLILTIFIM